MSVFSKSIINSLVASIFIINGPLYADEAEYVVVKEAKEQKAAKKVIERRIEVKAKSGKPVEVFIVGDGQEHMFKLSPQELKDLSEVSDKLEHLDAKTKARVEKALANVSKNLAELKLEGQLLEVEEIAELADLDGKELRIKMMGLDKLGKLQHLEKLEGLKELDVISELVGEEHAFVIRERIGEHGETITVDVDGMGDEEKRLFVIDGAEGEIVIHNDNGKEMMQTFVLGEGNTVMKGHVDAILKLIKHGEFSSEELDKLQQMLDSKR